jgi:hypothetical protein
MKLNKEMTADHKNFLRSVNKFYPGAEMISHDGLVFLSGVSKAGAKHVKSLYKSYGVDVSIVRW